jgi:hypothetical protein
MSVEIAAIYQGVKTGANIVTTALRYLDDSFNSLFLEIAKVHYASARQAFTAAAIMNDVERRNVELQVANGHLRDAFNSYQHFLNQRRNALKNFINSAAILEKKVSALSRCIEIATLIAVTYAEVGAEPNAKVWKDEAWRQFAIYEPAFRKFAKDHSYVPDPPHKMIFIESSFQMMLQKLESERVQLDQIFRAKGIA